MEPREAGFARVVELQSKRHRPCTARPVAQLEEGDSLVQAGWFDFTRLPVHVRGAGRSIVVLTVFVLLRGSAPREFGSTEIQPSQGGELCDDGEQALYVLDAEDGELFKGRELPEREGDHAGGSVRTQAP